MEISELLDTFTREQRIDLTYPDILREVDGPVIRHVSQSGEEGFIIYSHLDETNVEEVITAQIERYQRIPQDFEWKVYDYDTPLDMIDRLARRGFAIEEPEALLVLDLTTAPEALSLPIPESVIRVTDPDDIDAIVTLENTVWGIDHHDLGEFLKRQMQESSEIINIYISYEGSQAVSAAWVVFHPGTHFASLWGGSTLPEFRGRGHYSRLLAARAQDALARGYTLLTVDASPMSRPILEKRGFQYLAMSTPCKWTFPKST